MYKLAIVEDEDQIRQYFSSKLQKTFENLNFPFVIEDFSNGDSFMQSFKEHQSFQVIFLDIEMPGTNGIEVCRQIRNISDNVIVVFISSKESLVFDTFEVAPFRFIRKRYFDELLPQLAQDIKQKLESSKQTIISITEATTGNIYTFDLNDLLYVEAQRKDCCFVTRNDSSFIRTTFSAIQDQLSKYNFIQTRIIFTL